MKIFKFKTKNPDSGFTLIEAIVATAVFAFVVSSVIGVYISGIQLDRKTRSQRAVAQNARFITEFLGKEFRNGSVNYSAYTGSVIPVGNTDLYITNQAGDQEHIYPSVSAGCDTAHPCDLILVKNSSAPTNLNSSSVKITKFGFYIQPLVNPFTSAKLANEQPRLTLVLQLTSVGTNSTDISTINLETTFSSRIYPSRQ